MKKIVKLTRGEKFIYLFGFVSLTLTIVLKIFAGAQVGNLNLSVEKYNYEISMQQKENESLVMQVNELTAFDNVKDIVDNMGLSYNNENIIVINR